MSSDRQDLVRNAVVFLNDPSASIPHPHSPARMLTHRQSRASPLTQRIQFLEAKGLTPAEIDLAITAVVSGTVTYGAVALFKKYLLPHLQPPTSTAYEEDRDALTAQFDAAEALLKEIQAESAAVRAAVEAQKEQINETTKNVDAMVREVHDGEAKTRDEMREIREEVNSIREMLPKMIERNKESQTQSLGELQHELKSLKALLLSRGPTMPGSSLPPSPLPVLGRPSIPAWQLAGAPSNGGESPPVGNGKGKEVDTAPEPKSTPADVRPASPSRSRSLDGHASPPSTGQLAESALSNLRKSLASQRPASPSQKSPPPPRAHKSTLEDRLRATFTIGEASSESTPAASSRLAETPNSVSEPELSIQIKSPSSMPLPESRVTSPLELHEPTPVLAPPSPPSEPIVPASPTPKPPQVDQVALLEAEVALLPATPDESWRVNDVDALQERLKLVEQRFSDVSTSFKRLQAEKAAADAILRELTPLETISDSQALRDFVQNVILKSEISLEEITRLNGKLETQEDRIEELRDTHRLESASQSAQIEKQKKQLAEAEALLAASQGSIIKGDESAAAQKAEIDRLLGEVERSKRVAKDEEEKRVKAISLLKTVRQKLVKAEKDRDDVQRDVAMSRDKEKGEREKEQLEKSRLQTEVDTVNSEREKAITGLKAQFDREIAGIRDRHEKEIAGIRGQFELEALTTKSSHSKDVATLTSRISFLELTLTSLTNDKNAFFDQLQLRQAELESAQSHLGLIAEPKHRTPSRREQDSRSREPTSSAEDVARLLSAAEAKYESKLADLKKNLSVVEKERNESEAQWSRKLRDKVRENDDLKQVLGSATKSRELDEEVVVKLKDKIKHLEEEVRLREVEAAELRAQSATLEDVESSTKAQETETSAKIHALEQLVEEVKSREAQLRASNKTLREELRKVQSSAALLERQRNPGVGYWTSRSSDSAAPNTRTSISSTSSDSRVASPAPPTSPKNEEEVNLEYLRNVILQFLEHKEMRPNLVKVLSIILHFTPQETRRLVAKV
ncbi:hypothetical protein DFH09DRAFT_1257444 [Mycena vulgaris]|nr:hypothetical protein DFH09DRAFT_1257444 [Mycena vulgaris]